MPTKKCYSCKRDLPLAAYSKNSKRKDGLCGACKECNNTYHKVHYRLNKQTYLDKNQKRRRKIKDDWKLFKSTLKCQKCGFDKHPAAIDFHHRDPQQKDRDLARLVGEVSQEKIEEELKKCDILCANCHRILHAEENDLFV